MRRSLLPLLIATACELPNKSIGMPTDDDGGSARLDVGAEGGGGTDATTGTASNASNDDGGIRLDIQADVGSGDETPRLDVGTDPGCEAEDAPWCLLCPDSSEICGQPCSLEGAECVSDPALGTRVVCEAGLWTCDVAPETPPTAPACACSSDSTTGGNCVGRPAYFPDFSRQCTMDEQCAIGFHTINCCGTEEAWGIRVEDEARFAVTETFCDAQYPGCGCPTEPITTDTGQMTTDRAAVVVSCITGLCTTAVM